MIVLAAALVVSFSPNPSHFGELVTVRTNGEGTPSFKPFAVREQRGSTYVLQCLDAVCVPGPKPRVLRVAGVRVVIVPRTTTAEVARPLRSFRRQTTVPPTTYRIPPGRLRVLLLTGALLLVFAAFVLAWPLVRRLLPEERDDRSPLERALDLVRTSLGRSPPDRRRALDLLARALPRDGAAQDALDLAWSRADPDPTRVEGFVERVEARK